MESTDRPEKVVKIAWGWMAFGDGWAVTAPTKKEVFKEYQEHLKIWRRLEKRAKRHPSAAGRDGVVLPCPARAARRGGA